MKSESTIPSGLCYQLVFHRGLSCNFYAQSFPPKSFNFGFIEFKRYFSFSSSGSFLKLFQDSFHPAHPHHSVISLIFLRISLLGFPLCILSHYVKFVKFWTFICILFLISLLSIILILFLILLLFLLELQMNKFFLHLLRLYILLHLLLFRSFLLLLCLVFHSLSI